jgi:hypothetical protein
MPLSADCLEKNRVSVEIKESLLTACKPAHVNGLLGIDTHTFERRTMSNRRNYEPPAIFEPDEASVEQVVDARR